MSGAYSEDVNRRFALVLASTVGLSALAGAAWAAGPPRYRACGHVQIGFASPLHAHNVSCAIARVVAERCSSPKRTCFGELPLPYHGVGDPYLPQAPSFKPLGFECYQVWGTYTAGLPPPPANLVPDPKLILCYRMTGRSGPAGTTLYEQLVAYLV